MFHDTPFLTGLSDYIKQKVYPFHTPGHKGGRGINEKLIDILQNALTADVSLMNELDDLHCPNGFLKKSQDLAATLYGADKSFFSVNGTSGAIHAMVMSAVAPSDKILLPRNVHRSVYGALVLSGAIPVYIYPDYDEEFDIAEQISVQSVKKAFEQNKDIKAILVTSPDYYGCCADVKQIAQIAHENGAVCLVDEAHGPHLGFSEKLPMSAIFAGADIAAQSTHKIVGAMTQCSVLHVKSKLIDIDKVCKTVSVLTTTSPNQILLASLDAAFGQLAENGKVMAEAALKKADYMRQCLKEIKGINILDRQDMFDRTKITVNFKKLGLTGFFIADKLREKGFAVELADRFNVLFLITYADDISAIDRCINELIKIVDVKEQPIVSACPKLLKTVCVISPREVFYKNKEKILMTEAVGRISAQEVTFYPPGIPAILPGELISKEVIDYCNDYMTYKNECEKYIDVVKDER